MAVVQCFDGWGILRILCAVWCEKIRRKRKVFHLNPYSRLVSLFKVYVSRHLALSSKHHGCVDAVEHFLSTLQNPGRIPEGLILSKNYAIVEKNSHVLKRIIDVVVLCSQQNIPLGGHTEDDSIFIAILHNTAQTDKVLSYHLQNADPRAKYTSPEIQYELISLYCKQTTSSISRDVHKSLFF